MATPERRSGESFGWLQADSKPTVCFPSNDERTPMVGHATMVEALPPLHGQTVPAFPHYAKPSGTDLRNEGYISKREVKSYAVGARGTKGMKWKNDNAVQNERLKERRDKWWRSQRLERAAKRGSPWGTQMTIHEVKVRMPGGWTPDGGKEVKQASASIPMRQRKERSFETESFLEWFRQDEVAKSRAHQSRPRSVNPSFARSKSRQEKEGPQRAHTRTLEPVSAREETMEIRVNEELPFPTNANLSATKPSPAADLTSDPLRPNLPPSEVPASTSTSTSHPLPSNNKIILTSDPNHRHLSPTLDAHACFISEKLHLKCIPSSDSMAGAQKNRSYMPRSNNTTTVQQSLIANWRQRPFLDLQVGPIRPATSTLEIWQALSSRGNIDKIDLWERHRQQNATVRFRPPPTEDFFTLNGSTVSLRSGPSGAFIQAPVAIRQSQRSDFEVPSPVRQDVKYPETIELSAECLSFGVLIGQNSMSILRSIPGTYSNQVKLILNLRRKQIGVHFYTQIADDLRYVRFFVAFEDLQRIVQVYDDDSMRRSSFILHLPGPPPYSKFLQGAIHVTHDPKSPTWKADDAWYRQTSIESTRDQLEHLKGAPASLRKAQASIDLGRWTTYRLTFHKETMISDAFRVAVNAFRDFNVAVEVDNNFSFADPLPTVFDFIDPPKLSPGLHQSLLEADFARALRTRFELSFEVRYQLEVCISNNWLCEYGLGHDFLEKLCQLPNEKAVQLLEHVAFRRKRFYNPMEIFDLFTPRLPKLKAKVLQYCNVMRTATVTATTIIYSPPTVEMTNRVLRQYHVVVDRFLRVRFEDDKFRGNSKIYATNQNNTVELFTRIKRVMTNGITLGDRHYEFVAFGNSQLRDHGAYFFASTPHYSASNIRAWLGSFEKEKIVAKHAARMGQCFSSTRAIISTPLPRPTEATLIEDITRNGHTFSDGVGKMSPLVAKLIAMDLGLDMEARNPPSCYQFRLGGCKGVLATSPDLKGLNIELRRSQFKFDTQHHGLEIIRWAQFWNASLNRQLIIVLSFLGVKDQIFLTHQERLIQLLERAMLDDEAAQEGLHASIDPNQMTLTLSSLVSDGFRGADEPFVTSCLRLWRAWSIKYLKEKAKIPVKKGACVLGVIDETASLRGHFEDLQSRGSIFAQQKEEALPEIFLQITHSDTGEPEIITGKCILARNPSLHPGDIRVVRAVHVKALEHHQDVVVLPQTGDRDLSSMCSGGDLDGDDYVVIWDQDFLPKTWFYEPMDYTAPEPQKVEGEVTTNDITTFYVNYMKQDFLGRIAIAHLACADDPDVGLAHPTCLTLARLHSQAVDFPKTGVPATYPRELIPFKWPHFMEKRGHGPNKTRRSYQILGKLFDAVERVKFMPNYGGSFDERILNAYQPSHEMMIAAAEIKQDYDDALQRIMAQHEIKSEFEVWTTFVLSHSQATGDFKFHEQIGRLSTDLKDRFRKACMDQVGDENPAAIGPFAVAMYMVTQLQLQTALGEVEAGKREKEDMPFISFPWLMQDTLGSIAKGLRYWAKTITKAGTSAIATTLAVPTDESQFEITQGLPLSEEDKRRLLEERNRPIINVEITNKENVKSQRQILQAKSPNVGQGPPPEAQPESFLGFKVSQGLQLSEDDKRRLLAERTKPISSVDRNHDKRLESTIPVARQQTPIPGLAASQHKPPHQSLVSFEDSLCEARSGGSARSGFGDPSDQANGRSSNVESASALLEREFQGQPSTPVASTKGVNNSNLLDERDFIDVFAAGLGPAITSRMKAARKVSSAINQNSISNGDDSKTTVIPPGRDRASSGESDMWELVDSDQSRSPISVASPRRNNSPIVTANLKSIDSLIDVDAESDVMPKAKKTKSFDLLVPDSHADNDGKVSTPTKNGVMDFGQRDGAFDIGTNGDGEAKGNKDEDDDDGEQEEEIIDDPFNSQESAWGALAAMNRKMRDEKWKNDGTQAHSDSDITWGLWGDAMQSEAKQSKAATLHLDGT